MSKLSNGTFGIDLDDMEDEEDSFVEDEEIEEDDITGDEDHHMTVTNEDEEIHDNHMESDDENENAPSHVQFLPRQLGMDANKLHVMKSSLFDESDNTTTFNKKRKITDEKDWKSTFSHYDDYATSGIESKLPVREAVFRSQQIPPYITANSKLTGQSSSDALLFNSRSFRACFGTNGRILFPSGNGVQEYVISPQDQKLSKSERYVEEQFIPRLNVSLQNSDCNQSFNRDLPSFALREGVTTKILDEYIQSVEKSKCSEDIPAKTLVTLRHEEIVWKLLRALTASNDKLETKRLVSQWLKEAVKDTVENQISEYDREGNTSALNRIFTLLSGNQIARATDIALNSKNYHLASIIGQSSVISVRGDLTKWVGNNTSDAIDADLLQIYRLLSGDTTVESAKGLDWLRKFGLHLWYKVSPNESLEKVFTSYLEQKTRDGEYTAESDMCYHILRLFTEAKHSHRSGATPSILLLPSTHTSDKLDFRLSWHVYTLLEKEDFPPSLLSHKLHTDYAYQLELVGLWQWAIYVLMHLEEELENTARNRDRILLIGDEEQRRILAVKRENAIKNILSRYIESCDADTEKFLLETLHIPTTWISEARALKNMYDGDFSTLALNYIEGKNYEAAHTLVVEKLGPIAILNDELPQLSQILQKLESHQAQVRDWETRGLVFQNYIDWRGEYDACMSHLDVELSSLYRALVALEMLYQRLATDLPKLASSYDLDQRPDSEEKSLITICISDMSATVSKVLVEVAKLKIQIKPDTVTDEPTSYSDVFAAAEVVDHLPIPESYRIDQLKLLCLDLLKLQ